MSKLVKLEEGKKPAKIPRKPATHQKPQQHGKEPPKSPMKPPKK